MSESKTRRKSALREVWEEYKRSPRACSACFCF